MSTLTEERRRAIEQSGVGRPFRLVQPHNLAFWVYDHDLAVARPRVPAAARRPP